MLLLDRKVVVMAGGTQGGARPGYWDVEACAWVDCEAAHVAPPTVLPGTEAVDLPTQRDEAETTTVVGQVL